MDMQMKKGKSKQSRVGSAKHGKKMKEDMKFLEHLEDMGDSSNHESVEKISKRASKKITKKHGTPKNVMEDLDDSIDLDDN